MEINIPSDRLQNKIAFELIERDILQNKEIKLLDVGSADNILEKFMPKNVKYYSHDVADYGVRHDFSIDLDKKKFPVKKEFFDIILCLETLEHTMSPEKVLEELRRISKKDARFVFSLPNDYNFLQRIYYLLAIKTENEKPWKIVDEHHHIHKPRIKDIINLVSKDFNIKKIKYQWESRKSEKSRFFKAVDKIINYFAGICPNLFARDAIMLCEKR